MPSPIKNITGKFILFSNLRAFVIDIRGLHVLTAYIPAIREGLSIKEPSGSYLMSGSRLDFGDCYTGIASSKVILMRNMTEAALHVDLTSDRPKEITFEMKLQQNRSRVPRAPRVDELLSPTNSDDGASPKRSFLPDGSKTPRLRAVFKSKSRCDRVLS